MSALKSREDDIARMKDGLSKVMEFEDDADLERRVNEVEVR